MLKIIRATTVPQSLGLFEGTMEELLKLYDIQLLSSSGERLSAMGEKYGVKTHAVELYRRISPIKDLRSLRHIISVFCQEKPRMVHSMTPKAGLLCMLAAWIVKIPVRVHTFTGLVWPTAKGLKRWILMLSDRITCACATNIIPEGEGVKSDLLNYRITKKPLRVLGFGNVRGVDMSRFSRREEILEKVNAIRDNSRFTFIFVGRIVRDKGINELCDAFAKLYSLTSKARLLLIGKYEDNIDPISNRARSIIDSNKGVFYIGPLVDDDLIAYYAASDCFVFPSYREGFPNTVLEAGAMGLPCIVTDINGSNEIITDGHNGIIVPPYDTESLFLAMKQMMEDEKMRVSMASVCRDIIAERYEQGYVRKCLCDYYKEIL